MEKRIVGLLAAAVASCLSWQLLAADVELVRDGVAAAVIVLPASPHEDERLAAREVREHVKRMSGAEVPMVSGSAPAGAVAIRVGETLVPDAKSVIARKGSDPDSFLLRVSEEGIDVAGLSPEGTLFAAYELLEKLGCQWFMPGEIGSVVPKRRSISLLIQEVVQVPSFSHRHLQGISQTLPWYRRMRLGRLYFPSCHGLRIKADIEKEPELFALVNGKRTTRQWCTTNPEVLRRTVAAVKEYFRRNPDAPWIGLGPNDGRGFCECERCRALDAGDWDPFGSDVSVTDRYIHFFNAVLREVHEEFPGKKLCFYCYSLYMRPPLREKPDPHIVPAFAPITLCRVHGMNNPVCPERSYYRYLMDEWGKLVPELFERGYYYNLACPGFPFSKVHAVRDETPYAFRHGTKGWRVECMPCWGSHTPTLYIAARLMWNAEADVDSLLRDFYSKFFGPAAQPMREYLDRMDAALREGDFHTGSSFNMPDFYSPEVMTAAKADLTAAAELTGDTVYGRRVAMFRTTYDFLTAFLDMLSHRNAFRFLEAKESLDRMRAILSRASSHEPPILHPRLSERYLQRLWVPCVEQGYERVTDGNELVAGLPDEWAFFLDPDSLGEDIGLFRDEVPVDHWMRLRTSSASWGDQGLRYYKGDGWYRASVRIPETFRGRRLFLWFGGADEKAKVWVNGKLVGESPGRAFAPFELEATDSVRFGQTNGVAVRVTNTRLNELGTGGITAPVMFWAKAPAR
jgi:hypothetical protein